MSKQKVTISLEDAKEYAARWRGVEGSYNKHRELHAFLIKKEDFIDILTEDLDAVRGYLGVDDNGVEKLMFVGTKYDRATGIYVDMLPSSPASSNHIYDMTKPCPPACDPNSELN